jgi:RNA polymerase sigma-70 factor, ECF subfamily
VTDKRDEDLMEAVKEGDEMSLEQIIRRHGGNLLGYLLKMTASRAEAEDLFQEAFIRVYRKARSYDSRRPFKPWLYSIATRLAIDFLRARGRRLESSLEAETASRPALQATLAASGPDPAQEAESQDRCKQVRDALEHLPERQRATVVLAYYQGLSYPEVARAMGCTVGTVKTQMSRAVRSLAELLPEARPAVVAGGSP